ncbi:DNA replication and repair protein RecO [Oceanicella actignis]|uniref:DNA repair protein RecO n=2 Tax=Oceanicella actignis TaxID=1189325 RepID=A0A1M7S095_9RHOB|nr:DNA replication and repair protein RecO [Oceanicella actignis]SES93351.1 DNA replication and repair protein RecO [Oceanicella actignis]SHN52007.1 DNA replication and repair protein RecO [Oceanicella actignis]
MLLTVRRLGEGGALLEAFTAAHGRHAGVAPGGGSRRMAPLLQPGAQLDLVWRARLESHTGTYRAELIRSRAAAIMSDGRALAAMQAAAALLRWLPEREPHPALYARTIEMADALGADPDWPRRYAAWELALLAELGFGLDLERCALTGAREDLAWISPRTGRAVTRAAGAPWADRLLPLPPFFLGLPGGDAAEGLRVTGHFLGAHAAAAFGHKGLPPARARLAQIFAAG